MNALDLAYIPVAAATSPWWAIKKRAGWKERFGASGVLPAKREGAAGRVLIHAVSVGEVNALRHLIALIADRADVVVSATTDTGLARARELYSTTCHVLRYPLDFSWSVRRMLDSVRPDAVALVELEVWPNFVFECAARKIPACVINGRLSERSFRGYRKISGLFGRVLRSLAFVAAQDADYASRFEALGVHPNRCFVTGSMKWDAARIEDVVTGASELAGELGVDRHRPLVVAGSTGPGEEALLLKSCPPDVQLLCAPRKPERFEEAAQALPGCIRRSANRGCGPRVPSGRLFLLDSIGELRQAYSLATVAVVGRSFGDLYGSDPIEPIGLGKATLIGPAVDDFAAIVGAFDRQGGILRTTPTRLASDLGTVLTNPTLRAELAERGRQCIVGQQGASQRHAELLLDLCRHRDLGVSQGFMAESAKGADRVAGAH